MLRTRRVCVFYWVLLIFDVDVENVLNCVVMTALKHLLTVAEKIQLLDYYEKENASARALADEFGIERTRATHLIIKKKTNK